MASDDAKEKMRLQLSLREIYAKSTLYYYGTNHSPATPQQQRPTPTTPSTAPAAAPTRRWELAELEPASPPPAKRARPEPAPAPAPAADEPELLFSPPFKFATTAGSYDPYGTTYDQRGYYRQDSWEAATWWDDGWEAWDQGAGDAAATPTAAPASDASQSEASSSASSNAAADPRPRPLAAPRVSRSEAPSSVDADALSKSLSRPLAAPRRRPSVVDPI